MKTGLLGLVALFLLANVSRAEGLITVDPNQSGAAKQRSSDKIDPRLAQKITYSAKAKMVSEILDELTRMTGVTLNAGYNKQDWQVRDRKMVIFVKDLPLAELMNSIARVMKFNWSKNIDADPPTYRLYMNRELLLEANKLLREQEQKLEKEKATLRAEQLDNMLNADKMTPEEVAETKEKNPRLYIWNKSGGAQSLRELCEAYSDIRNALVNRSELIISMQSLPPHAQSVVPALLDALNKERRYHLGEELPVNDIDKLIDCATLVINPSAYSRDDDPVLGRYDLGGLLFVTDGTGLGTAIPNPDDLASNAGMQIGIKSVDDGQNRIDVARDMDQRIDEAALKQMQQDETGEPLVEHEEDPELDVKVKLGTEKPFLQEYQEALAKESSYCIVSDFFTTREAYQAIRQDELEISQILRMIQDGFHYNWEKHGSVLEFRDRYWYCKRSETIPESWLADWRKTLKETGTMTFDQLAKVSQLSPGQYWTSINEDEALNMNMALSEYVLDPNSGALFGAYLSLNNDARKMLFSESGLSLDILPADVLTVLKRQAVMRPECCNVSPGDVRLRVFKQKFGEEWYHCFSFSSDNIGEPIIIKYVIPRYEWSRKYQEEQREKEKSKQEPASKSSQPILPTTN